MNEIKGEWKWEVFGALIGLGMILFTIDSHSSKAIPAAKLEATKGADISPKDYMAMTHPVGGCEQYIQKCGDGKCKVYPVCADLSKRKAK